MKVLIVHFIGLCLFTTAARQDGKLRVLLPRVEWTLPQTVGPAGAPVVGQVGGLGDVESHTAFIAFRKSDRLAVKGWTPKAMPGQPDYEYIVLSGETVTFETQGSPKLTTAPKLPKVRCCTGLKLRRDVAASSASSVAATFVLTRGRANTCNSIPHAGAGSDPRVDTKLRLNNTGTLRIAGRKAGEVTRTLTVRGNATVYVGNLPSQLVLTNPLHHQPPVPHGNAHHHLAYQNMFTHHPTAIAACQFPAPGDDVQRDRCGGVDFRFGDFDGKAGHLLDISGGHPTDPPDKKPKPAVNSECSNSSWP